MEIALIDKKTGENLGLNLDKRLIKKKIEALNDTQKADLLTQMNYVRRASESIEKLLKDYIKSQVMDLFEEGEFKVEWQDFKVTKIMTYRFSKTEFEEKATPEEKEIYEKYKQIEEKYKKPSASYKI